MSETSVNLPPARNWRDLPQAVTPRMKSRAVKKRTALAVANVVGLALVLGAAGWGICELFSAFQNEPARITDAAGGVPIRGIEFRTDGVLDKAWVTQTIGLSPATRLMDVNLDALRGRLLASGQVEAAVVTRKFPSTLTVTLRERSPVARIMVRDGSAAPRGYLVARDGSVYSGAGYDARLVSSLPFLDGVRLVRDDGGFAPIQGMDQVATLLGTARSDALDIYRTIRVVSLARLAGEGVISVRLAEADEVIFGAASDGYYRQLARLDYILSQARLQNPPQSIKSVNLAIGGEQVPVAFNSPSPDADGSSAAPRAPRSGAARAVVPAFFPPLSTSSL